jgi:hypothetical protein
LFEDEDVRKMESKEVWSTNRNYTVINPIMFKLTKKIELATGFNVSDAYSSTPYQVTSARSKTLDGKRVNKRRRQAITFLSIMY